MASAVTSVYFRPAPVLNSTTRSLGFRNPEASNRSYPAVTAAPSGERNIPSFFTQSNKETRISESGIPRATPSDSRKTSSMIESPYGFGTRRPDANVAALGHISLTFAPASKALTIGAQPADCTAIIFGRFPGRTQPNSSSSAKAFHMPINPTPPPVG